MSELRDRWAWAQLRALLRLPTGRLKAVKRDELIEAIRSLPIGSMSIQVVWLEQLPLLANTEARYALVIHVTEARTPSASTETERPIPSTFDPVTTLPDGLSDSESAPSTSDQPHGQTDVQRPM